MTKFKFHGHQVTFEDGKIQTEDRLTYDVLSPLVKCMSGGPKEGDPLVNIIVRAFGRESITDIEHDDDPDLIY